MKVTAPGMTAPTRPWTRETVSRPTLERGLALWVLVWGLPDKTAQDADYVEEWGHFMRAHGAMLFGLALAACDRLEPAGREDPIRTPLIGPEDEEDSLGEFTEPPEVGSGPVKREVAGITFAGEPTVGRIAEVTAHGTMASEAADAVVRITGGRRIPGTNTVELPSHSKKEEAFTEEQLPAAEVERANGHASPNWDATKGFQRKNYAGTRIGNYVALEPTGTKDRYSSAEWRFRCPACGTERVWGSNRIARQLRLGTKPRCQCKGADAPRAVASTEDGKSEPVLLTEQEHELAESGVPLKMADDGTIEAAPATDVERAAPPRNPRLSGLSTLVGLRFGTWKVVERSAGGDGMSRWKCRCVKCGASKDLAALGAHGLRTRPPACGGCRLRSGAKAEAREDEGGEEEAAE